MSRSQLLLGLAFLSLSVSCVAQTPPARAQDAANELNTNQRFGRMELVAERISDEGRAKFFEKRKAWGTKIQIADSEIEAFKMDGESKAEVTLKVSWYRVDQGDLLITTVKQSWKDFKGTWKLTNETRFEGDYGLLGDAASAEDKAKADGTANGSTPANGNGNAGWQRGRKRIGLRDRQCERHGSFAA